MNNSHRNINHRIMLSLLIFIILLPTCYAVTGGELDLDDDEQIFLQYGDIDEQGEIDVSVLQKALMHLGYLDATTGQYGKATTRAVKAYQTATGVDVTGSLTYIGYSVIIDDAVAKLTHPDPQAIIAQIKDITNEQALQDIIAAAQAQLDK